MITETPFMYNDERSYAIPFDDGLTGNLSNISDVDWFSVNIDTEGTTEISFSIAASGLWHVDWYDPNMQLLSGRNISDNFVYSIPTNVKGIYSVRVKANSDLSFLYSAGDYSISVAKPIDTSPTVSSFAPKDGASAVGIGSNVDLGFNEAIQRGTGYIYIRSGSSTGTIVESYNAATSSNISISEGVPYFV